jgi:hypothetical protein
MFMQFTPYEQTLKIFIKEHHSSYNEENDNLIQFGLFFFYHSKKFKLCSKTKHVHL